MVLFPYTAQNEDELTLEEGQTILIIRLYLYFVLVRNLLSMWSIVWCFWFGNTKLASCGSFLILFLSISVEKSKTRVGGKEKWMAGGKIS